MQATGTGNLSINGTGTGLQITQDIVTSNFTFNKTGGTIAFNGNTQFGTVTANAGNYNLEFRRGITAFTPLTLNNTGSITIGDDSGDIFSLSGLTATGASSITVGGTISTGSSDFNLTAAGNIVFNGGTLTASSGNINITANTSGTTAGRAHLTVGGGLKQSEERENQADY